MLNFLDKYKLIKGQAAFGVELVFNTKDTYTIIALELTSTKEGVEVSRRFIDITLEELAKKNTKNIPVYFSIGGKGVIHKKIKAEESTKDQDLLTKLIIANHYTNQVDPKLFMQGIDLFEDIFMFPF